MFTYKIVKKDFLRKKAVTLVVFSFVLLASMLVATGSNLVVQLTASLDYLFERAKVPHFVQMHAGDIDREIIGDWARTNPMVKEHQVVEMLTVDGSALYLGSSESSEKESVMDVSFVTQNPSFDLLLDTENRVASVKPGEVGVPVYYMQEKNMKQGDTVRIKTPSFEKTFTVATFVRDAQMNTSLVHSKRFLVHPADYARLGTHIADSEYLVEFLLHNMEDLEKFADSYQASGLPGRGPAVDIMLFKVLNALSDGLVAGVVILLSLLLVGIAVLCLRFTILATIEEDYREIGVMKAVGVPEKNIRGIYLSKYMVMGAVAVIAGYGLSLTCNGFLTSNILMFIGKAPVRMGQQAVPVIAAGIIWLMVGFFVMVILRRCNRISAVEALRSGSTGDPMKARRMLKLTRSRLLGVNAFIGLGDIVQRFRMFALLCFVFFFCGALILVPVNFLTTIQSPAFISYMGIGKSQVRIDLRQTEDMQKRFESMVEAIASDNDVKRYSALVTSQFTLVKENGETENINIETGDLSVFPLDYLHGTTPENENEIALSVLNSKEMEKDVNDTLVLRDRGMDKKMRVCGIYQDVTNGGRTAKALLAADPQKVLWYTVSLDLVPGIDMAEKVSGYSDAFHPARVTNIDGYLEQTLGNTIQQLGMVTMVAVLVGLLVSVLITSLFLKMIIARDAGTIAIMKSLGFSLRHIRMQYLTRSLVLLGVGIVLGTVFANTLGQDIVSLLWSFMGASHIRFVIDPLQAYLVYPLLLVVSVSAATFISIRGIRDTNIVSMISE